MAVSRYNGGLNNTRAVAAGLAGGLAASWLMSQFQAGMSKLSSRGGAQQDSDGGRTERREQPQGGEEPATVKAATAVSENVFGYRLQPEEKRIAGPAVHYAYGTAIGGLYGLAAEQWPLARKAEGLLFGAALWLVSDEIAVPALGFAKSPPEYSLSSHAYALGSHLVYGLSLELVRRGLRKAVLAG